MTVKRFGVAALAAIAVAAPMTAGVLAPAATAATPVQVSYATEKASADADAITNVTITRLGSVGLAMEVSWSGGSGPYDVLIDPTKGEGRFDAGIDGTTLKTASETDRKYCVEVFGADGSESGRVCEAGAS